MANDLQETVREILIGAIENAGKVSNGASEHHPAKASSTVKGVAAGLGAVALVPVALKGVGKLASELGLEGLDVLTSPERALEGLTSNLGDRVGAGIGDKITQKVEESGGASGILKDTLKGALPFGGGGGGTKGGALGVGKGRRMPVQQSIDIGVPLETVYNQWTQFELWPEFMHRVTRVTQEDECTVSFATKIWGKTKEFNAEIETQRPNERIKWRVTQGLTHAGIVTFHELGPSLTRVLLGLDVEPGGMLEKFARGARHIKRAARGDLHRFKAFIEMQEAETGAWRGVIEDGEVVQEHDPKYDKGREYADPKLALGQGEDKDDEGDEPSSGRGGQASNGRSRSRSRSASASASGSSRASRGSGSRRSSSARSSSGTSGSRRKSSGSSAESRGSGSSSAQRSSGSKTRGRQSPSRSAKS